MRGRFRILLGAAAGVGKTYRMLQEGRQAAVEGVDVVIGYLEPHGRSRTEDRARGIEAGRVGGQLELGVVGKDDVHGRQG
jgi:two-component system sensor histidine kinase KdpD